MLRYIPIVRAVLPLIRQKPWHFLALALALVVVAVYLTAAWYSERLMTAQERIAGHKEEIERLKSRTREIDPAKEAQVTQARHEALNLVQEIHELRDRAERELRNFGVVAHAAVFGHSLPEKHRLRFERYIRMRAQSLRDYLLDSLPTSARDDHARKEYDGEPTLESLRVIANDLERLARLR